MCRSWHKESFLTGPSLRSRVRRIYGLLGTRAFSTGLGDTRALADKHVRWDSRVEVTLTGLQALGRGDPWLSAGLLKDGDPIYLVKWESDWPQPQLLHIQSIADVELFGINGSNYGNFVIERSAWEARYGILVAGLQRGVLASAAPAAPAVPSTPVVGGADFPPSLHRDIRITTPPDWLKTRWPHFGSLVYGAKTVVTYLSTESEIFMIVAAAQASNYRDVSTEDILVQALNRERDSLGWRYLAPDKSRELTEQELRALIEKVTVGDTEASSVVYYSRKHQGLLSRETILKRGNLVWEFYSWTWRVDFSRSLLKVLADVEFLY